jgi:hypothetical protein
LSGILLREGENNYPLQLLLSQPRSFLSASFCCLCGFEVGSEAEKLQDDAVDKLCGERMQCNLMLCRHSPLNSQFDLGIVVEAVDYIVSDTAEKFYIRKANKPHTVSRPRLLVLAELQDCDACLNTSIFKPRLGGALHDGKDSEVSQYPALEGKAVFNIQP